MAKSLLSLFKPGQTELDFSDPEQAQAYISLFGGEEYVRSKYPLFYDAWLKTQKYASAQSGDAGSGIQKYGGSLGVIHTVKESETKTEENTDSPLLESEAVFTGNPPVTLFMQGEMSDQTEHTLIDAFSRLYTSDDYTEQNFARRSLRGNVKNIFSGKLKKIHAETVFNYSSKDGMLKAELHKQDFQLLGGGDIFEEIKLTVPNWKQDKMIQYVYGRPKDDNTDYAVSDDEAHVERNPDGTGKRTGIYLQINGEFTVKDCADPVEYAVDAQSYRTQLQFANEGVVYYDHDPSEIASFFHVNGKKVTFSYAPFWGDAQKIECRKFGSNAMLYLYLYGYFKMDLGSDLGKTNVPFGIQSIDTLPKDEKDYSIKDSSIMYIPPLHILWGCFGKNCRVRMADGTEKAITELVPGDLVRGEDGSAVEVISAAVGGHEDKMIHIETVDGHTVDVSDYHPVKTRNGTIPALDLRPDDVVVLESGESPVRYVYPVDYDDEVCSVSLNGGYLIANGFVTGDKEIQADVQHRETEALSNEVMALSKEMELAFSELL